MIIVLIVLLILAVVLSPLYFYRTRMHAQFSGFKNGLKNKKNEGIHNDISHFKMKITKDQVVIIVNTIARDYTEQDELDTLIDKLPKRLDSFFKLHFEDKKADNIITFTAKRKKKK